MGSSCSAEADPATRAQQRQGGLHGVVTGGNAHPPLRKPGSQRNLLDAGLASGRRRSLSHERTPQQPQQAASPPKPTGVIAGASAGATKRSAALTRAIATKAVTGEDDGFGGSPDKTTSHTLGVGGGRRGSVKLNQDAALGSFRVSPGHSSLATNNTSNKKKVALNVAGIGGGTTGLGGEGSSAPSTHVIAPYSSVQRAGARRSIIEASQAGATALAAKPKPHTAASTVASTPASSQSASLNSATSTDSSNADSLRVAAPKPRKSAFTLALRPASIGGGIPPVSPQNPPQPSAHASAPAPAPVTTVVSPPKPAPAPSPATALASPPKPSPTTLDTTTPTAAAAVPAPAAAAASAAVTSPAAASKKFTIKQSSSPSPPSAESSSPTPRARPVLTSASSASAASSPSPSALNADGSAKSVAQEKAELQQLLRDMHQRNSVWLQRASSEEHSKARDAATAALIDASHAKAAASAERRASLERAMASMASEHFASFQTQTSQDKQLTNLRIDMERKQRAMAREEERRLRRQAAQERNRALGLADDEFDFEDAPLDMSTPQKATPAHGDDAGSQATRQAGSPQAAAGASADVTTPTHSHTPGGGGPFLSPSTVNASSIHLSPLTPINMSASPSAVGTSQGALASPLPVPAESHGGNRNTATTLAALLAAAGMEGNAPAPSSPPLHATAAASSSTPSARPSFTSSLPPILNMQEAHRRKSMEIKREMQHLADQLGNSHDAAARAALLQKRAAETEAGPARDVLLAEVAIALAAAKLKQAEEATARRRTLKSREREDMARWAEQAQATHDTLMTAHMDKRRSASRPAKSKPSTRTPSRTHSPAALQREST